LIFSDLPKNWLVHLDIDSLEKKDELTNFVLNEYETKTIFPLKENIFNAFQLTSFEKTKVIILGQDPYHGDGQAHGLSFSVQKGVKLPPSLKNIFKELESDIEIRIPNDGDLSAWSKQGVLLLNTVLTVEKAKPASHQKKGWEEFSELVLKTLSDKKENLVFILWGTPAQKLSKFINADRHLIIKSVHPSPLSSYKGFFGSKPFSSANDYLKENKKSEIDWSL
jgi:uracil-DNA glycosylase